MPETTSTSKSTAFTITFDDNKSEKVSENLQEAFFKFKKFKEDEIELSRKNRLLSRKMRNNPERMLELRMKFLEQAKKYFGVPYAKKYFKPDTPEYNAPLFLDCCGLVRRVMRDLEKDFGFRIGGGNQAYMFDTLPKTIHDLKDVKPGDLVFISGIYHNPKMKKQRHNMTHVEIMLGEGEKTIGARWNNGKVQVFDSYKFEASSFHSPTYYFKSIDTWLLGICRSFCPKHFWPYKIFRPSRKSIFCNNIVKKKKKLKKPKGTISSTSTTPTIKHKKTKKKKLKKKLSSSSIATSVAASEILEKQNSDLVEETKGCFNIVQRIQEDLDEDADAECECENIEGIADFQLEDDIDENNNYNNELNYEEDDYEEYDDYCYDDEEDDDYDEDGSYEESDNGIEDEIAVKELCNEINNMDIIDDNKIDNNTTATYNNSNNNNNNNQELEVTSKLSIMNV